MNQWINGSIIMPYDYQLKNRYFAQVADDIKDFAEKELQSLGAAETSPVYRGIYFTASPEAVYRINYHTRLITRVLAPLTTFNCHSDKYLYRKASEIPWEDFLDPSRTFAVFATVSHSHIKHSKFAALRLKDAVVDQIRDRTGERPSIDTREPDLWINLHIEHNKATISLDLSGGALHRRGYRTASVEAPMMETLAAAIIACSEWDGVSPLHDPFCGSGTLLCEAYMRAARMPAGILRSSFGFQQLPDFDQKLWDQIKEESLKDIVPVPAGRITGSDRSSEAVEVSLQNCDALDPKHQIAVTQQDVSDIEGLAGYTIVCNPPYGIRSEKGADLSGFYKRLGDFLKQRCTGSTAYIYFGERQYVKALGLKPTFKRAMSNGGLKGQLAKVEVY